MATVDDFSEFGGQVISDDPFAEFGGEKIPPKIQPIIPLVPVKSMSKDNTNVKNQSTPINNTPQAIQNSKKILGINQLAQEKDVYYHPDVKNVTSGDQMMDLLYKNQWLMDIPGVGDYIKNKAYNVARSSGASALVNRKTLDYSKTGYTGSGSENNGPKLLDVYFGKQKLPQSQYKPTSDYMGFLPSYSIKTDDNIKRIQFDGAMDDVVRDIIINAKGGILNPLEYDYKTPLYINNIENSKLSDLLGVDLGGHKTGIGFDKEKNLPYVSISDAWDFEPNGYSKKWNTNTSTGDHTEADKAYIESSLMHKAGKPFKVYDRFYFDPKTNKYIPDSEIQKIKLGNKK